MQIGGEVVKPRITANGSVLIIRELGEETGLYSSDYIIFYF